MQNTLISKEINIFRSREVTAEYTKRKRKREWKKATESKRLINNTGEEEEQDKLREDVKEVLFRLPRPSDFLCMPFIVVYTLNRLPMSVFEIQLSIRGGRMYKYNS